jgi:hypothetical protein
MSNHFFSKFPTHVSLNPSRVKSGLTAEISGIFDAINFA